MFLRRTLALLIGYLFLCTHPVFAAAPPISTAPLSIDGQFVLDKSTVVQGEPVWITFRLVNSSTAPIQLAEAVGRGSLLRCEYGFLARDSAGRVISPPPVMMISGFAREVLVAPGQTYRKHLFLSDWLTLSRPGYYTLRCWRGVSPGVAGWSAVDPSKAKNRALAGAEDLPLTVLPTDKKALGLVIQSLGKQAQSDDSTIRDEAAISLASISDPRIVPVLGALLARPDPPVRLSLTDFNRTENSKYSAVEGLEHFPCHASAEALLRVLNQPNDDLRSAAGQALKQMHYADRVLPALKQELRSLSSADRARAVQAIAALQDPRGFPPLAAALHDPSEAVRVAAAKGLGTLRDRRAVPVLKSHFKDPDLTLRLACVESLVPLRYPVLAQWLTPIVRSYASPGHEAASLEAMLALRQDCGDWAALAGCLNFDDPRPSPAYNFLLITQMDACRNGSEYAARWLRGGDTPEALQNNRKVLADIKRWLPAR